ncbi:MAG: M23 family metallopeptidase [Anaerolineaceae bacterium]|jgi:hypothetical protein
MSNLTYTPSTDPAPRRKRSMLFMLIPTLILAGFLVFLIFDGNQAKSAKSPEIPTPQADASPIESLLFTQLPDVLEVHGSENWVLDDIQFSDDKTQALLWMAEKDPETGDILASEPIIILAVYESEVSTWALHIQTDLDFGKIINESKFQDTELAERFPATESKATTTGKTYGGYLLPWKKGLTKRLTWSVSHTSCAPGYCYYAFDFADGTMFDLLAAKGGYVYHWKDSCRNGDSSCTNSITIEDRSTTPWTYQLYLHIAQNSVPKALRQVGTPVLQGQKIANVDDTGYSTGHHVHFMVVEQQTLLYTPCRNYCWGKAVDITFLDVDINYDPVTKGGRPRLVEEAREYGGTGRTNYTSGNTFKAGPYKLTILFMK